MKHHIDNLKNFGFRGEGVVEEPGINAKMNEIQAAYGLLQLKYIDGFINKRKVITEQYRLLLKGIAGIRFLPDMDGVSHGYSCFPILVDEFVYGISREELYLKLKGNNVFARRYFYPLISTFKPYCELPSAKTDNLRNATNASNQVLYLPIYPDLGLEDVQSIIQLIKEYQE